MCSGRAWCASTVRQFMSLRLRRFNTIAAGPARARRRTRGSGSSRSAPPGRASSRGTCARCRSPRRSRSRRSVCTATLAASHDASAASSFAMLASAPHGSPRSNSSAARMRMRSAASTFTCARAIGNCTPWFWPIGRPKTTRSFAYLRRALDEPAAVADALGRDQDPLGVQAVEQIPEALALFADERRRRHLEVVEEQLRRRVVHHRADRPDRQAVADGLRACRRAGSTGRRRAS